MKNKLYTIQEKGYAEKILKKGFMVPIDLCEDESLAQHLVNVGLEDPAILEIDVEGLSNTFQRVCHDEDELKDYMPEYTNYFTDSPIPASHITKVDFADSSELGSIIYSGMMAMKENVTSVGEMDEVTSGMRKCVNLGICSEEQFDAEIKTISAMMKDGYFDERSDGDDFSKAVASISGQEDGLELPDR